MRRAETRDQVGERRVHLVVHEEVRFADTVPELDHLGLEVPQANALVAVPAEDERLAVLEHERVIGLRRLLGHVGERAVVEHVAVLQDLHERRALVLVGAAHDLLQVPRLDVDAARDEARLGTEGEGDRVEGMVDGAQGRRLGHLPHLRRGRVLALGEAVDLVVEEQDVHVEVPAQDVDQVVTADRQCIAVAGDDPDREVGA